MKFLAIDTSGKQLLVVAVNGEREVVSRQEDCAMRHSVLLMDEIERVLGEAGLTAGECDFFACVAGPGSFTGIRIGIATVKGLCLACDRPALALTSLQTLAYADRDGKTLSLVDAGHGNFYACCYDGERPHAPAAFMSRAEVEACMAEGYAPVAHTVLFEGVRKADAARGLLAAARAHAGEATGAHALEAVYLRKSSAEEGR